MIIINIISISNYKIHFGGSITGKDTVSDDDDGGMGWHGMIWPVA